MRSCSFEKVDEYALINKEDKEEILLKKKECCVAWVTAENDRIVLWKTSKLN